MNKVLIKSKSFLSRNTSTILTVVGGVGVVATAVLAVKATPKALSAIEEAEAEKGEKLTKFETVKVAGPAYIPAAAVGVGTIVCVFGANVLNKHQQAALTSAYALIDSSYKEYKNKLKELYGEEAHNNIVDALAIEKAEEVRVYNSSIATLCDLSVEDGTSEPRLFYDDFANRCFESTIERVMNAEYHINRNLVLRGYVTLNEFYEFLGLAPTEYGSTVGWSVDDDMYWIDFNHRKSLVDDDTLEVYVIETPFGPTVEALQDWYW